MSSLDESLRHRCTRLAGAALLAGMLAGCFQPMYADRSLIGGNGPNLRDAMRDVEISKIDGRVGQEVRNDIIFELSGGEGNPAGAPYKLQDVANDKVVFTDKAIARVSIDRTQQRYARVRAVRDAENRAAKVVAEQIRARVASFFLLRG